MMSATDKDTVAVIGSGIIGMTTALCLSQAGYKPVIISRERPAETTSAVAAALWYPYKAEPIAKVSTWAKVSLDKFRQEQTIPEAGIVWRDFTEYLNPDSDLPWWHTEVEGFKCNMQPVDLPVGRRLICHYRVPIIDSSMYLAYLQRLLHESDVQFLQAELADIDRAFDTAGIVVNCSGIGAVTLVKDPELYPARGQVIRIRRQANHQAVVDLTQEPKLAHITPRINDTILGGTYEKNEFSRQASVATTQEIIDRCRTLFPDLGEVSERDILGVSCGLRPVRSTVRVEQDSHSKGRLFHNYGHGGAGFTLSWGCAQEICDLVKAAG